MSMMLCLAGIRGFPTQLRHGAPGRSFGQVSSLTLLSFSFCEADWYLLPFVQGAGGNGLPLLSM